MRVVKAVGCKYYQKATSCIQCGDVAELVLEPDNPYDENAIMVKVRGRCVGYIPRLLTSQIKPLIGNHVIAKSFESDGERIISITLYISTEPCETYGKSRWRRLWNWLRGR